MMHKDIDGKECMDDDVRDEVLNIMNFYFDKGFKVGITKDTVITEHKKHETNREYKRIKSR